MKLSLVILAKHHAEHFRILIHSALPFVDEIIVGVDDGAEDGIFGYAEDTGKVQYFKESVNGDFGGARGRLTDRTTGDWIMHLDTDENLGGWLWENLRSLAEAAELDKADIVTFPRHNRIDFVIDNLSWPDWQPRMHRRGLKFVGRIHESLQPPGKQSKLPDDRHFSIIHRKTPEDQFKAIKLYNSIQGNLKQAIVIFEWRRPKYLKVLLDSLYRAEGIEEWPILLSVDGPEYLAEFQESFPRCRHVFLWPKHAGNLWHVTRSLQMAFDIGFERVMFLDGDVIVRRDVFKNIPEPGPKDLFVNLTGREPRRQMWLTPTGNILERSKGVDLLRYVQANEWIGLERPGFPEQKFGSEYPGYDAVYCRYLIDHGMATLYRDKSYVGHIGVCGVDCHAPLVEAAIFNGPPETWLDNAARLFDHAKYPAFTPPDFRYED